MHSNKISLQNKPARIAAAALALLTLVLSFTSCSGEKTIATLSADGLLSYNNTNYSPVDTEKYDTLFYDTGEAVAKVADQENVNVYGLRYANDEKFLCVVTPAGERTLYVAAGGSLVKGGRKASNILLKYKNGFVRNVEKETDFNTAMTLDTIKGSATTFSFDPEKDNVVSVFTCYDGNPVATVWFGTLVLKDETLIYVLPGEDARTLTETVDKKKGEQASAAKEYTGTVIENAEMVAEVQRITGLA